MAGDLIRRCLSIRDLKTGLCYNLTKSALYILAMTIYSIMNSTCVIVRGSVATKLATPMIFIMSQPYGSMEHASSSCSHVSVYSGFQVRFEWVY